MMGSHWRVLRKATIREVCFLSERRKKIVIPYLQSTWAVFSTRWCVIPSCVSIDKALYLQKSSNAGIAGTIETGWHISHILEKSELKHREVQHFAQDHSAS